MSPLLAFTNLVKHFGNQVILEIAKFSIQPAKAYVLTGPNGAGKTTFLRILAGLESTQIDQFIFRGKPISFSPYPPGLRKEIIYVHQHPILFSTSVARNIGYGLSAQNMDKKIIQERVEEAMEWAGVLHLRHNPPRTLSGGEKQRVAIARARILKPPLLLLDEPTSNLDGKAREQVIELIPTLIDEGSSVLMASHDPELIAIPELTHIRLQDSHFEFNDNTT